MNKIRVTEKGHTYVGVAVVGWYRRDPFHPDTIKVKKEVDSKSDSKYVPIWDLHKNAYEGQGNDRNPLVLGLLWVSCPLFTEAENVGVC